MELDYIYRRTRTMKGFYKLALEEGYSEFDIDVFLCNKYTFRRS